MIHFDLVSPFVLLIGLMTSPILGILFSAILAQSPRMPARVRSLAWLPAAIGAGLALLAAWALRGQTLETVIGNWAPVSFTGLPLALAAFAPSIGVVIAWITLYFIDSLRLPDANPFVQHPAASALIVASLTIVALSNNLITMLVGLGVTDLLAAYLAMRRQANVRQMLLTFVLNGLSIMLLLTVVVVHYASGNSLHLPLARLPQSASPLLALALALRLGFAPFRASPVFLADLRSAGGVVGGFLVLIRLPTFGITQLPAWFYALALISALLTLAIGVLGHESTAFGVFSASIVTSIATASAYLASTSAALAIPGATSAAAVAWLLGATLITSTGSDVSSPAAASDIRLAVRIIGALCLVGLPLTAGFVGYAGVTASWLGRGLAGLLLVVGWMFAMALMAFGLLRLVLDSAQPSLLERSHSGWLNATFAREALGWFAAIAPITLFGIAPGLLNAGTFGDALSRNGWVGWLAAPLSIALGALLWRFQPVWQPALHSARNQTIAVLNLEWLYGLLGGVAARLRTPFAHVFTFLESDGALIWAVIVVLLLVLISRPGGP